MNNNISINDLLYPYINKENNDNEDEDNDKYNEIVVEQKLFNANLKNLTFHEDIYNYFNQSLSFSKSKQDCIWSSVIPTPSKNV
jgi:hypothetical protein